MKSRAASLSVVATAIAMSVAVAQPAPPDGSQPPANPCPPAPRKNPTGKALMAVAECNASHGKVATAWRLFRQAGIAAGRDQKTQQKAADRADAMVKLLPKLTVHVPDDVPMSVSIDDTDLPPEQWGVGLAIDPGAHVISSSTEDGSEWTTTVQIGVRENKTIDVKKPTKPKVPEETGSGSGSAGSGSGSGSAVETGSGHVTEPGKGSGTGPSHGVPEKGDTGTGKLTLETVDPVAYDHDRAPRYHAVRTKDAPKIDGELDDPIWQKAPKDSTFYLETSKPFGLPTDEPTSVQVAYDDRYLYVGITSSYATPHMPKDTPPLQESAFREYVGVYVDSGHTHSGLYVFALSPDGNRADWEVWNNGTDANFEWTGLWEGKTSKSSKGWTAEFQIPWGTVALEPNAHKGEIGINFRRSIAFASVMSWSLSPPGSVRPLPSFAGHLDEIHDTKLTQIIRLVPYITLGWAHLPAYKGEQQSSWLRNLNGKASPFSAYGGVYGRLQAGQGIGADFVVNPDFSQVSPDAALANLDRFELFFPEVREFFINTASTYAFGSGRYQLFYSRRVGLRRRLFGFDEVPILFGANAGIRRGGTTLSVLEVYNDSLKGPIEAGQDTSVEASHTLVARGLQVFGPSRIGVMALDQTQPFSLSAYNAYGTDGTVSLYRDHLVLSGWLARSGKRELIDLLSGPIVPGHEDYHYVAGTAWQGASTFKTQELQIDAMYTDVGKDFRGDLGFFERTGVRRTDVAGYYRPQIHSDLIRSVSVGALLTSLVSQDEDRPIQNRLNTVFEASLLDAGKLSFTISQAQDTVSRQFFIAARRIGIQPGSYSGNVGIVSFRSSPGGDVEVGASYTDGYYFGGRQRILSPTLTAHFQKFATSVLFEHYQISAGPTQYFGDSQTVNGDRVSARLLYAFTPDIRASGAIEANTLDPVATTQLVASWRIDSLTSMTAVANRSAPSMATWVHDPTSQLLLKFTYGMTAP